MSGLTERARNAALARSSVDAHIRALVDAAPPLTPEQRDRLAALLHPGSAAPQRPPSTVGKGAPG